MREQAEPVKSEFRGWTDGPERGDHAGLSCRRSLLLFVTADTPDHRCHWLASWMSHDDF